MFGQTLDNKKIITAPDGNEIVDLTTSIFARQAREISGYKTIKMTDKYVMRPDRVSTAMYGSDIYAEMILKYTGISNPFSLADDDVLMIPEENTIYNQLAQEETDEDVAQTANIQNYYKFSNGYTSDSESYDKLANMKIDSGVVDPNIEDEYTVPYISSDGTTSVTIRNGKMYFGEDTGMTTARADSQPSDNALSGTESDTISDADLINGTGEVATNIAAAINAQADNATIYGINDIDTLNQRASEMTFGASNIAASNTLKVNSSTSNLDVKLQAILDSTATSLADNCVTNGMSLVDFTRATRKNS